MFNNFWKTPQHPFEQYRYQGMIPIVVYHQMDVSTEHNGCLFTLLGQLQNYTDSSFHDTLVFVRDLRPSHQLNKHFPSQSVRVNIFIQKFLSVMPLNLRSTSLGWPTIAFAYARKLPLNMKSFNYFPRPHISRVVYINCEKLFGGVARAKMRGGGVKIRDQIKCNKSRI